MDEVKVFGLLGEKLTHSYSKIIHEAIDGKYHLFEVSKDNFDDFMIKRDFDAINVTIPYKQQVIPYLDELSDEASRIGAVNCVKILADGRRVGYNTDIDGIRLTLDGLVGDEEIESALVLGSGGASQAVRYVLEERGIKSLIVSRNIVSGDITYDDLSAEVIAANKLIINASPVGMYPRVEECPNLPYQQLTPQHRLFDLVYNPQVTLFMQHGKAQGARVVSGLDMLYAQAESAWRIWNM